MRSAVSRLRGLARRIVLAGKMRRLNAGDDALAWLAGVSRATLPSLAGTPGYSVPDLQGASVVDLQNGNRLILCAGAYLGFDIPIRMDRGASNNIVVIGPASRPPSLIHFQGSDNLCLLGGHCAWPLDISVRFSSDRGVLFVGREATSNGTTIVLEGAGRSIVIGDDCMFAAQTSVRTSDLHAIRDADQRLINPSADVVLAPHVWIGMDSLIGKGVSVGEGAVIGAKSLVTRDVAPGVIVGGAPAKVIKTGVTWSRDRPADPEPLGSAER